MVTGDTDVTLFDIGTHASRSTYAIGNAVLDAGTQGQGPRSSSGRRAGWALPPRSWTSARAGSSSKADPEPPVSVAEIAREAIYDYGTDAQHIMATGKHQCVMHCPNFQAGFAEIEVDVETGVIKVLKLVIAHDIGRAINPLTVEGCLEGGAAAGPRLRPHRGPGHRQADRQGGQRQLRHLQDARRRSTCPRSRSSWSRSPIPPVRSGPREWARPGITNVAPSIANALYDAVGIRVHSLPMTPEKVLEALEARRASEASPGGSAT